MAIKVKLNLPTEENMDAFQDRMCTGIANALKSKPKEFIKELRILLSKDEKE